jgi:hypothetical protein
MELFFDAIIEHKMMCEQMDLTSDEAMKQLYTESEPEKISSMFEKWNKQITILERNIKQVVIDTINKKIFKETFIVDLDVKLSGLSYGKKSFVNLEITLFTTQIMDFREQGIKNNIKDISDAIYVDCFLNSKDFNFSLTKKDPQMEY